MCWDIPTWIRIIKKAMLAAYLAMDRHMLTPKNREVVRNCFSKIGFSIFFRVSTKVAKPRNLQAVDPNAPELPLLHAQDPVLATDVHPSTQTQGAVLVRDFGQGSISMG